MPVFKLRNQVQKYDWGSNSAIPDLLGLENTEQEPMAELWMGAHHKSPSEIVVNPDSGETRSLLEAIGEDPNGFLGERNADRFYGRLPFLFKVLSAEHALSIQAHPTLQEARHGSQRENAAGIPLDAPHRNYRDANHKPELLCALTDFWALRGFRPLKEIFAEFRNSGWESLNRALIRMEQEGEPYGVEQFFQTIMESEGSRKEQLIQQALKRAEAERTGEGTSIEDYSDPRFYWITVLHEQHPGDIGVLAPLYLNCFVLHPGQSMYLSPGVLHAYLHGTALEVLANSDNVLRGGLTSKHIDLAELLHVVDFRTEEPQIREATPVEEDESFRREGEGASVAVYRTDAPEFELYRIDCDGADAVRFERGEQPEVLLCLSGSVEIQTTERDGLGGPESCTLNRGESCIVTASVAEYRLSGTGRLYRAVVPQS